MKISRWGVVGTFVLVIVIAAIVDPVLSNF